MSKESKSHSTQKGLVLGLIALFGWIGCAGPPAHDVSKIMNETLERTDFYFLPSPPNDEAGRPIRATPLYWELDRLDRKGGPAAAGQRIVEVRSDPAHLETYSLWLRDQYMYGPSPEALYGLQYFDALIALYNAKRYDLYDASLHDTMVMMVFLSSELLAHENVARCEEQPNGMTYRLHWRTARRRGEYARRTWDKMSAKRQAFTLRFAQARVEAAGGRPPSPDACATGMKALKAAADAGLCEKVAVSDEHRSRYVGGSVAQFEFCDSRHFSTFVNDTTWVIRRAHVRQRYWDRLFTEPATP